MHPCVTRGTMTLVVLEPPARLLPAAELLGTDPLYAELAATQFLVTAD